jgi:RNA polymerase sigma-70 factor (ECF subfamily)
MAKDRNEQSLIQAVVHDGDEGAFRQLYRRHTPRLLMTVQRLLASRGQDAEDVVQETWIRVVERLGGFRGESAFATWLTGIGLNVARNHLRQQGRRNGVDWEAIPEPPAPRGDGDASIDLERAISLLPDGYRSVLVLHDVEGWKHQEIAVALGVAVGTCKSQLFAARRWVRSYLGATSEVNHE